MPPSNPSLRSLQDLENAGFLSADDGELQRVAELFSVAITPVMHALINPSDRRDPIGKQFLPSSAELRILDGERSDPIGDDAFTPTPGIVHRYPDRVLLKLLKICPVYCRFCFRREQVGQSEGLLADEDLDKAILYIAKHPDVWEVIFTGGDPLMLSPRRLKDVISRLKSIPHVKVLRIHTRVPVVDPERITSELIDVLRTGNPLFLLLHCNHVAELTSPARTAIARFIDNGLPMLSQSVLLRAINDSPEDLKDLMRAFVELRIKPHYLHMLDLARGTSHFRVDLPQAQSLMKQMRGHLSGLCQPSLMLDIPGGAGKIPVGPTFLQETSEGYLLTGFQGETHLYPHCKE